MAKILLATGNEGKIKEFKKLLEDLPIQLVSLKELDRPPKILEDGKTFLDNAKKKALELAKFSNLLTLADDSGLEVDYLEGAPGVYSARFAGENASDSDNNKKLLQLLAGLPLEKRQARFICCLVIAYPDGNYYVAEGKCEGLIAFEPKGQNGFGYDPIFYLPQLAMTMAELSPEEKNSLSHRAEAMRKMKQIIIDNILRLSKE
ncbi:MAG TPA: XTP/dITP diphosphatase [Clostridia bacterium]|nr:XTP/dITP diphosphatase [Clostridia bacterium]